MYATLIGSRPQLSLLLAAAMILSPVAATKAQQPSTTERGAINPEYLTPQSIAAVSLRPKQILTNPALRLLPIEVAQAASEKFLGMPATSISEVVVVGEPLLGTTPYYAVFLKAEQAWDTAKFAPELTRHTTPGEVAGQPCLVSRDPNAPSLMVLKNNTLLAASPGMLEKLLNREAKPSESVLQNLINNRPAGDDLYAAVDLQTLRPLINMGLMQPRQSTPREFDKFYDIPMYLQSAELALSLDGTGESLLVFHTATDSDAEQLEKLLTEGIAMFQAQMRQGMDQQMSKMRASSDPVERSIAAYFDRISSEYTSMFVPQRDGTSFRVFDAQSAGGQQIGSIAVIGILVALLLPAVQAAREAARRNQSMNNLKQFVLALLNYEATYGHYPPHASYTKQGKPLLSWRVQILPFMEQQQLYEQFRQDEPWDSPHNKKLVSLMPEIFLTANSSLNTSDGKTNYVAPVGKGLLFDGTGQGTKIRTITDGTSNTVALVEVNDSEAVIWTKPDDWEYNPANPKQGLGGVRPGVFLAAFCDGHVSAIADEIDATTLKALFTKAGGEAINAP